MKAYLFTIDETRKHNLMVQLNSTHWGGSIYELDWVNNFSTQQG